MLLVFAAVVVSRLGIDSLDKLRGKLGELRGELQDTHRFHDVYNYSFQWACEVRAAVEGGWVGAGPLRGGFGEWVGGLGTASSWPLEWRWASAFHPSCHRWEIVGGNKGIQS